MNKEQYAEFHKYLAMLIYDYNKIICESRNNRVIPEIREILLALEKIQKICIIDGK